MPPRTKALKHVRVGPGIDVAACGLRGGGFAVVHSQRFITCPGCRVAYAARVKNKRVARETAARRAHFQGHVSGALWVSGEKASGET